MSPVAEPDAKRVPAPSPNPEPGATGRRWAVSLALIAVGLVVLAVGIVVESNAAIAAGAALVLFFGAIAGGARKAGAGAGTVRADADFDAPPLPPGKRKIYLPPGVRPKRRSKK